jgi:hypothetical protein
MDIQEALELLDEQPKVPASSASAFKNMKNMKKDITKLEKLSKQDQVEALATLDRKETFGLVKGLFDVAFTLEIALERFRRKNLKKK